MKNKKLDIKKNTETPDIHMIRNYLNGILSQEENRKVEEFMMEDEFSGDALEGLNYLKDPVALGRIEQRLQKMIDKKIAKRALKRKKVLFFPAWILVAILIILITIFAGYMIIKLMGE